MKKLVKNIFFSFELENQISAPQKYVDIVSLKLIGDKSFSEVYPNIELNFMNLNKKH